MVQSMEVPASVRLKSLGSPLALFLMLAGMMVMGFARTPEVVQEAGLRSPWMCHSWLLMSGTITTPLTSNIWRLALWGGGGLVWGGGLGVETRVLGF